MYMLQMENSSLYNMRVLGVVNQYLKWILPLTHSPSLPFTEKAAFQLPFLLTHQVSNLDSSEPKSDVLPITPWVSVIKTRCKNRIFFLKRSIKSYFDKADRRGKLNRSR